MSLGYPYEYAVSAGRNKNRAYEAVIKALERAKRETGMTRKQLAQRMGWKPSQVSTYLSGPRNWTLDTIDSLLHAVDAEMDYNVVFNCDRVKSNFYILEEADGAKSLGGTDNAATTPRPPKPPSITIIRLQ